MSRAGGFKTSHFHVCIDRGRSDLHVSKRGFKMRLGELGSAALELLLWSSDHGKCWLLAEGSLSEQDWLLPLKKGL